MIFVGLEGAFTVGMPLRILLLGVEGAIVGKAIYTGDVDLARAITEIERAG